MYFSSCTLSGPTLWTGTGSTRWSSVPLPPSERSRGEEERGDESRSGFKAMPGESIRYCPFSTGDGSSFWAGDRPPGATGIRTGRDGRLPGGPVVYAASPTTCVTSFFRRSLFPTWHRRCWRSACISAVVRLERELRPSYRVRRPLPKSPRDWQKPDAMRTMAGSIKRIFVRSLR